MLQIAVSIDLMRLVKICQDLVKNSYLRVSYVRITHFIKILCAIIVIYLIF
jgi:hypothetical protein